MKIISGGQTGVDRAALDAALEATIDCGGWCPEGRKSEDGMISDKYPVMVLPGSGYRQRTKQNVIDSDGTIIIYFDKPTGGTKLTIDFCIKLQKPHCLINASEMSEDAAIKKIQTFIQDKNIINVAGPRASGHPMAYSYTKSVLLDVFREK